MRRTRTRKIRCWPAWRTPRRSWRVRPMTGSSSTSTFRARTRPSSSPSSAMFDRIFVPASLRDVLSGEAWLQALLDVERALAEAEARAGVIPDEAARAIAGACRADRFDPAELADGAGPPRQ